MSVAACPGKARTSNQSVNNMRLEHLNRLRKPGGFVRCFRGGSVGPEPKRLPPMRALAQTKRTTPVAEAGTERQRVSTSMRGRCDPAQGLKGASLRYRTRRIRSTMKSTTARHARCQQNARPSPLAQTGAQPGRRDGDPAAAACRAHDRPRCRAARTASGEARDHNSRRSEPSLADGKGSTRSDRARPCQKPAS
jgi:hypothetical protein